MARDISNNDNLIDSRDVLERIQELTDDVSNSVYESVDVPGNWGFDGCDSDSYSNEEHATAAALDACEELVQLKAFVDECEGLSDWRYGAVLIRESYFEDYARQLAEDIGAISDDAQWPCTCIDWEKAARELQMDYSAFDFNGTTYYARA